MRDKYDEAIEYLTDNPDIIHRAWGEASTHPQGCLFGYVGTGGCLTMIRNGWRGDEQHPELTVMIRADERIPTSGGDIVPADLPVFAEWQRKIDVILQRD